MLLEVFTDNLSSAPDPRRWAGFGVNSKHVIYQSDSIWARGRDPDLMTQDWARVTPGENHTGIICKGISGEKLEKYGDT